MWPTRRLCDLFQIEHPIIQAPMTGSDTRALAVAVSNAGGLGSLGAGEKSPDSLRDLTGQMRAGTNRAFNLNFFAYAAPQADPVALSKTVERLRPYYQELGLGDPPQELPEKGPGFDEARLALALEVRPPVISFHFGVPDETAITSLKEAGITLMCSATTVAEARALEASGMDAIIAQGREAGGHRGSHVPTAPSDGVGTLALVPQVVDAVDVPVIAAGGIGDGRGIAAAFALGASGVQIGTGFLSCPEAGTDEARRALLHSASDEDTMVTDAVSGRSARGRRSRYASEMAASREALVDYPYMYAFSGPLVEADKAAGGEDFGFHLYGQAAALNRELSAAELLQRLVEETFEVFGRLSG